MWLLGSGRRGGQGDGWVGERGEVEGASGGGGRGEGGFLPVQE